MIAPGAVYGGNRFLVSPQPYALFLLTEGVTPAGPIAIADVPRLSADRAYRVELAANALTMPVVGIFDASRQTGYLLGVEIYGSWGVTGVNVSTLPGQHAEIEVCLPVRRTKRYRFCDWIDAKEHGVDLEPGRTLRIRIRIRPVRTPETAAFVTRVAEFGFQSRGTQPRRPNLSFAAAAGLIEDKLNTNNWDEAHGYRYPLRALLPKALENVLAVGRCASTTPRAHGSSRVNGTSMMIGEAAGALSALALTMGRPLREVPVGRLQETLAADGAVLEPDALPARPANWTIGAPTHEHGAPVFFGGLEPVPAAKQD